MINIKEKLYSSRLYCFTPDKYKPGNFSVLDVVEKQLAGGADIIQLREKNMNDRDKLELAVKIKIICEKYKSLFIVNDDILIAKYSNADGLHLGQDDLDIFIARDILGPDKIIGLSTHNIEQFAAAQKTDADYTAIGPIWQTQTKKIPDPEVGINNLQNILKHKKKFTVAIGGINLKSIKSILEFNIDCFAIVSDIICSENITDKTLEYSGLLKNKLI